MNKEEPEWRIKQEKEKSIKQTKDIIKKSYRWMGINLAVGVFDLAYAVWVEFLLFKILLGGLSILMFYMMYTHYKIKERAEKLLTTIDEVIPDKPK